MSRLDGLTVVVTGAAGGLGSLIAAGLARRGASVIGVDRVASPACAETISADLANADTLDALATRLAARRVDILANVAGVQYFGHVEAQGSASLRLGYAVNLVAPAILAAALIPQMRARGDGQIVNIGSMMGAVPFPFFAAYSSAKAGLLALSQAMRRELSGSRVAVTHVSPRAMRTALNTDQIERFMAATGMTADEPAYVASRIVDAIERRERDVSIGLPERFYAQINATLPGAIDRGLAKQTAAARALLVQ